MGLLVLVFGSSGELDDSPHETQSGVPVRSGTKVVVGRSTSYEEVTGASTGAPMEIPSSLLPYCAVFGKLTTKHYEISFPGAFSDGPCFSEAGDASTEAEVRRSRRRKQAVITRRLVPLSGQEPDPVDFGSHERSRVMLEQALDDGIVDFKRGYSRFE